MACRAGRPSSDRADVHDEGASRFGERPAPLAGEPQDAETAIRGIAGSTAGLNPCEATLKNRNLLARRRELEPKAVRFGVIGGTLDAACGSPQSTRLEDRATRA
jgi:hypothetical protein